MVIVLTPAEYKRAQSRDWYLRNRELTIARASTPEAQARHRQRELEKRRAAGIRPRPPAATREQALAKREAARRAAGIKPRKHGRTPKPVDPEVNRARVKAWRQAHPERVRELKRNSESARRARKRGQFVEHIHLSIVWERDEGVCHICGLAVDRETWHLDHVIPIAKGGEHSYANVAVSHPRCNLEKGAR